MYTYYDLLQQIKIYGTFIYTGDRESDLALITEEVKTLKSNGLFSSKEYSQAMVIIMQEKTRVQ
ncbi:YqgQ family protein [Alkalicoccobacillus murimartini]|uniref:Uncharacterized protein YqgQ n=1 Tax=Alkalicoccobacillus murimartini TaxID=171685 RepID=A0ABT9YCM0_9BACI|nr:YqgQ family protein [Alkalicoccobacillus murimartini]MDQ0205600.1 uncharacterized protein YqgQ [Alkalicoccobacillus murimartini]